MRRLLSSSFCFCLLLFAGISLSASAQTTVPNEWTWVSGNDTIGPYCDHTVPPETPECGQSGVYGTLGIPAAGNNPGSRDSAVSWTDAEGHLWLLGGEGFDSTGTYNLLDDLWEFDPSESEWIWMNGASAVPSCGGGLCAEPPVYGTLGTPSPANIPGSRAGATSWTDASGNLWLFGGASIVDSFNDLWKFEPGIGEWAWMGGSNMTPTSPSLGFPGVYGTLGTPAAANVPGSRAAATSWMDSGGHFWLFGGTGYDSVGTFGSLDDLWEFYPATNEWAWMGGDSTIPCNAAGCSDNVGVYGTLGTAAPGNKPGDRSAALGWIDESGNLWLFGGSGKDGTVGGYGTSAYGFGDLNDLWMFSPVSSEWTWMAGSSTASVPGVYGVLGSPANTNVPGSREVATGWTDKSGNLWLFGGSGIDAKGIDGILNDLWVFRPSLGRWTWMGGSSTVTGLAGALGVYGTLQTPGAENVPGSRQGSVSWTDSTGNLWLFGGSGVDSAGKPGELNDLWEYQPPNSSTATPTFSVATGTYTAAQTVTITDATAGASIYYTTDGTTPTKTSPLYSGAITVANTETLQAIAVTPSYFNSAVASADYVFNFPADFSVTAAPAAMTLTAGSSGTATISISPQGSFASAVSFACSGLLAGDACSFSPATVTPSGPAAVTTTVTVTTAATAASLHGNRQPLFPEAALAGVLCLIGFRKRRSLQLMLLLGVSVAGFGLLSGCGGGSSGSGSSGTPPVISTVTVTATSGSLAHTATFSLTVN